jgi:hypothetical protein
MNEIPARIFSHESKMTIWVFDQSIKNKNMY